jgi:hypothetical protein
MRTCVFCGLAAMIGIVTSATLGGCSTARTAPLALADSEIQFTGLDSSLAMGSDWRMAGDSVGLWLLNSGASEQSPMIFALASDGSPEFITGDSLGMLLVTGDVSAIATVLESSELD